MQLLSPHLSLEELTFSSTAVAHGIDNTAPAEVVDHLATLAASLEKVRAILVDRTKDLGEMSKRITRLESWKVYLAGIASAFTFIGALIGGGLTLLFRR